MSKEKNHKIECTDCHKNFVIKSTQEAMDSFEGGQPVQTAMPHLDSQKQTMLLGKRCNKCTNVALA